MYLVTSVTLNYSQARSPSLERSLYRQVEISSRNEIQVYFDRNKIGTVVTSPSVI